MCKNSQKQKKFVNSIKCEKQKSPKKSKKAKIPQKIDKRFLENQKNSKKKDIKKL